jgi:hypothetical protein
VDVLVVVSFISDLDRLFAGSALEPGQGVGLHDEGTNQLAGDGGHAGIRSRTIPACGWLAQNTSVFSRWSIMSMNVLTR